ncbi:MAG: FAD binding domain-containing protein [Pseudomonadota bacterium]
MTDVETVPTIADAARHISRDTAYLGGGTVLMRAVNAGEAVPKMVRTADPRLRDIAFSGDRIALGAGVTMAQVLGRPELDFLHPVARQIGGPQVRNMGTVGGNIFAPHPYGDFTVALLALGAEVQLAGSASGKRRLEDVLRDRTRQSMLVSSIDLERPQPKEFGFLKVSRVKPKGVSVMSIAAHLPMSAGRIRGARVAWGAMAATPMRSAAIERVLEGQSLDSATLERAVRVATDGLDPLTDPLATSWYRKEVAGVHLRRLLTSMGVR